MPLEERWLFPGRKPGKPPRPPVGPPNHGAAERPGSGRDAACAAASFATTCSKTTTISRTIQALLGHDKLDTTARYTQV